MKSNIIKFLNKLSKSDNALKSLALVVAIVIFLIVNQMGSPIWNDIFSTTKYIPSVPLNIKYDSTKYYITGIPSAIPVTISGSENEVASASKKIDALLGDIDISGYGPGEYKLNASNIIFNDSTVDIKSSISEFNLVVQEKISKDFPININYINGSGSSTGYILDTPTLSINSVKITGGNLNIDSISTVMGLLDLATFDPTANVNSKKFSVKLIPYDKNGEVVKNVELSNKTVEVDQNYKIETVELPISFDYVNNTGKYISSICDIENKELCQDNRTTNVKIYGDNTKIQNLIKNQQAVPFKIDLSNITGDSGEVSATPVLDSGIYLLGDDVRKFSITLESGKTKELTGLVPLVENLIPTLTAKALDPTSANISIKVTGASSIIDTLTNEDIVLFLDLENIKSSGVVNIPINVKVNKNIDYELIQKTINLDVTEVNNG